MLGRLNVRRHEHIRARTSSRRGGRRAPLPSHQSIAISIEKAQGKFADLLIVRVHRKMAGVKNMYLSARNITLISVRTRFGERGVVLPPNNEQGWLAFFQV